MKKCMNIQLVTVGICVCISVVVLCGCGPESTPFTFDNTAVSFQRQGADLEDAMPENAVGKNLGEEAEQGSVDDPIPDIDSEDAGTGKEGNIVVYICGAVKHPGVYTLPEGSRVNDVLEAAGGFSENASTSSVNLAARLQDEEMIQVLTVEEQTAARAEESATANQLVNINSADIDMLCNLPGIGESKARDIIMYRKENGAFQNKEDIMKVAGIKENLYKRICDLITVK